MLGEAEKKIVYLEATRKGLDPLLVLALIEVESGGVCWRVRFEPRFPYYHSVDVFAQKNGISQQTETTLQRFSWGVLQVMGARARELGFDGHLTRLSLFEIGLIWGVKSLEKMALKWKDEKDLIAAHNAGTPRKLANGNYANQKYVDKVLEEKRRLTA